MKKSTLFPLFNIGLWANIIEWYEFLVYIHLSSIISQLFFKPQSDISGLIQTFLLLAISYLVRPLGSVFFGYFAEKRGRKASLRLSLMMMSVPTIFIGCLPIYASIGYFSTCLLVGGVIFEVLGTLFKEVRALGMSLSFTLPTAIVGGLTPVLLTAIIHKTGWTLFPAFYCMSLGLLALPVTFTLKTRSSEKTV